MQTEHRHHGWAIGEPSILYVIRYCRALAGRPKVLSINESYHGSLDETLPHIGPSGKLEWLHPEAFEKMFASQNRFSDGLEAVLARHDIPWSLIRSSGGYRHRSVQRTLRSRRNLS